MTVQTAERAGECRQELRTDTGRNPYVFVVGCPRSGTTLLQRMLDHHPRLAVANDTHFIPRVLDNVHEKTDPLLTPELTERTIGYHRFARLHLQPAAIRAAAQCAATFSQFVSGLYAEFGRMRGKRLAGEKTPDYVRCLPRLHALFPWARSVHLIRDGRDVALSALNWAREDKGPGRFELWRQNPVAVCALWWSWQVGSGRRDGAALDPRRYCEVRYERLVACPEEVLRGISAFLDLPFAPEMLAFHEGKLRNQPGLPAKKAWLPPTPGLRDWRKQMSQRDVSVFEALAGDLLTDLGYERSCATFSPEIADIAARCRSWWDLEMEHMQAKAARKLAGELSH